MAEGTMNHLALTVHSHDAVYFEDSDGLKFEVVHMPEFPT
jgi:hypothetical protein